MSKEELEIIENLKEYLNYILDDKCNKLFYNDLGWNFKTIDAINALEHLLQAYKESISKDKKHYYEFPKGNEVILQLLEDLLENNNHVKTHQELISEYWKKKGR